MSTDGSSDSASTHGALTEFLGGLDIGSIPDSAWDNESVLSAEHDSIDDDNDGDDRAAHTKLDDTIQVNLQEYQGLDAESLKCIFTRAYQLSKRGQLQPPPVNVVGMAMDKGNGMVTTRTIHRGEVLFTEKAAVAVQIPTDKNGTVRACQGCFRSMEDVSALYTTAGSQQLPSDHLWPVPPILSEDFIGGPFGQDNLGRIVCRECGAYFCNAYCKNNTESTMGRCCVYSKVEDGLKLIPDTKRDVTRRQASTEGTAINEVNPVVLLASKLLCMLLHQVRTTSQCNLEAIEGLCGVSHEINVLELGQFIPGDKPRYTLQPHYEVICKICIATEAEQASITLDLYCRLTSIAARNAFEVITKSPFNSYYESLLREAGGRGTDKHTAAMQDIAKIFGSDGGQLKRGMDKQINSQVAVTIGAIFPLVARINHSCTPNAEIRSYEFCDVHADIVATREIEKGEEVNISYINLGRSEGRKDRSRRRKELRARYLFDCHCPKCQDDG